MDVMDEMVEKDNLDNKETLDNMDKMVDGRDGRDGHDGIRRRIERNRDNDELTGVTREELATLLPFDKGMP